MEGGSDGEGVEVGVREKLLQLLKQEITETSKGLEKKRGWIFFFSKCSKDFINSTASLKH